MIFEHLVFLSSNWLKRVQDLQIFKLISSNFEILVLKSMKW